MTKPVYLVVGASSGMGRVTALRLGQSGATVIVAARRTGPCEEVARQIAAAGGTAQALACDATDPVSAEALVAQIASDHGRLDGAFNNLGDTLGSAPLHQTPLDQWKDTIAVNLSAIFYLMRAQVPLMLQGGGGAIVNNSSTGGLRGTRAMADYSAAKWGLIGLTKSAALDYAAQGIRINVIAPGIIETEKFAEFEQRSPDIFARLREATPVNRFGEMEEIAQTVDWLLREAPAYLTGSVIPVDGGRTA